MSKKNDEERYIDDSHGGKWTVNEVSGKDFVKNAREIANDTTDYFKQIIMSFRNDGLIPKWVEDHCNPFEYQEFIDMLQSNVDTAMCKEMEQGEDSIEPLLMNLTTAVMWNRMIVMKLYNIIRTDRGDSADNDDGVFYGHAEEDW